MLQALGSSHWCTCVLSRSVVSVHIQCSLHVPRLWSSRQFQHRAVHLCCMLDWDSLNEFVHSDGKCADRENTRTPQRRDTPMYYTR